MWQENSHRQAQWIKNLFWEHKAVFYNPQAQFTNGQFSPVANCLCWQFIISLLFSLLRHNHNNLQSQLPKRPLSFKTKHLQTDAYTVYLLCLNKQFCSENFGFNFINLFWYSWLCIDIPQFISLVKNVLPIPLKMVTQCCCLP